MIGNKIIHLDSVDSTNNYLKEAIKSGKIKEGTVVIAGEQTTGRGQAGNSWISNKGENLTFSFAIYPIYINAVNQFSISKAVCLALSEIIETYVENVKIKWPNDIYVNEKKIAGILIENTIMGSSISSSVVGIGLNINQQSFPSSIPNATSFFIETGNKFNIENQLQQLIKKLNISFSTLKRGKVENIDTMYLSKLYRYKELKTYKANEKIFEATIEGVDEYGRLILKNKEDKLMVFAFKEVQYI